MLVVMLRTGRRGMASLSTLMDHDMKVYKQSFISFHLLVIIIINVIVIFFFFSHLLILHVYGSLFSMFAKRCSSPQCCARCTGFQSRDVSTSNWHAVFSSLSGQASPYLVDDIHLVWQGRRRRLRSSTDRSWHAVPRPQHIRRQELCCCRATCLDFGTAFQHTYATSTLLTTVSGVNLKCTGFSVATGVQCDIVLNCAVEILVLNWTINWTKLGPNLHNFLQTFIKSSYLYVRSQQVTIS